MKRTKFATSERKNGKIKPPKRRKLPMGSSPVCPNCLKRCKSWVNDSRQAGDKIRRRRKCLNCAFRYTTYEGTFTDDLDPVREWLTENLLPKIEALFKP